MWTDLTTIEVAMRQIASTELNYYEVEKTGRRAAERPRRHFLAFRRRHLARAHRDPVEEAGAPVSESEISPGRFWLGVYDVADGERNEEAEMFDLLNSTDLKKKVAELVPVSAD